MGAKKTVRQAEGNRALFAAGGNDEQFAWIPSKSGRWMPSLIIYSATVRKIDGRDVNFIL